MHAHGVAGDLADVLVREGDLVAAVAGADEVGEVLGGLELGDLGDDLVHGRDGGLFGIDLALDGGVGNHLAVLVEDDRFGVGGTYVATAEVFHTVFSFNFNYLQLIIQPKPNEVGLVGKGRAAEGMSFPVATGKRMIRSLRGRHIQTSSSNSTREGSTGSARMTVVM